jgi:thiol-disulfide isomerase/thioredoxin
MQELRGKVVLIDFWTYSCINCQRTLPYLVEWDKKYRDQGLVIIGAHAPEFAFEKLPANVSKAVSDAGIAYPVVLDNDYVLWNSYKNRYWPAKYFIDRDGYVRHTHF